MSGIKGITSIDIEFAKAEVKGHYRTYKKTGKRFYVDPFARNDQARALARDLASENWHTRTMAKMKTLPIESLEYIARDATAAAEAGETIGNPKAGQYRDEAHYANMEIRKRKKWAPGTFRKQSEYSDLTYAQAAQEKYESETREGLAAPGKYVPGEPIQFPKRFKTNGDITKFIIKITKTHAHDPAAVKDAAKSALRQFPLSSNKMIYADDLKAMDPEMRRVVLEAAVETDNVKYEGRKIFEESMGLKPTGEAFGRSDVQKTGRLASPRKYGEGFESPEAESEAVSLYNSIRPGDRVTIVNRFGQKRTGRVVMRGPAGWVLNLGGAHGTPGIASPENVVAVKHGGGGVALRAPSSYVEVRKADAAQTFLAYIAKNPDPPDKAIHALADKLGIDPDKFEARIYGILSDVIEHGKDGPQPDKAQLTMGIKVESEHTKHPLLAEFIARAHLKEIPDYYSRLKVMEDTSKAKPTVQKALEIQKDFMAKAMVCKEQK